MATSAGDKLGPYEIIERIGRGGMGEVWRAHDSRLGRDVAIKVCDEQFSERFEREARAVAALNHPNICTLFDVGPNYLVMELVEGPTLKERIGEGALPYEEAMTIARQIADAMEEAHGKNIVHRDLKPGNIKIKPDGLVKVLDFGLAKWVEEEPTPSSVGENSPTLTLKAATKMGMILGTAGYMSPEQAKGKKIDRRTDIWAFGVVLFEMLTARRLFDGETIHDVMASVVKDEPDYEQVPTKVRPLLKQCLAKDRTLRLRDIGDMHLLMLLGAPTPPATRSPALLRALPWAVAAVLLATTSLLAFLHFREQPPPVPETVRFEISPPTANGFGNDMSLSPDGRKLAFTAAGKDGVNRLWVRSLDSLEARSLANVEQSSAPFWSPDSRFLAFHSAGRLRKVEVSGGPPQTVCEAVGQFRGGAWSKDGVIVFALVGQGLSRVSAEGGLAQPLTVLERKDRAHNRPSFLPDGKRFLYSRPAGPGQVSVYAGSLDAKPEAQNSKLLLNASSQAVFAPASGSGVGRLLFLREGTLVAQPFDPDRIQLTGEAVPLGEGVGSFFFTGFFSVSSDRVLAYRGGRGANTRLLWLDRQGKTLGTASEPGNYITVSLSPDGTRIAAARSDRGNQDLWLIELARGVTTRFTFDAAQDRISAWSPDGGRLAWSSSRNGPMNLFQKASNGVGEDELLLKSGTNDYAMDWSRDGRFLLYLIEDPKTGYDVAVVEGMAGPASERKSRLFLKTEFNERNAQFSPDARWIAYASDESGSYEIFVRTFDPATLGGSAQSSGGKWMVSNGGGHHPRWRRDGKELYYVAPGGKVMAVEVNSAGAFQAGVPKPLFQAPSIDSAISGFQYDVTADGKRFLIIAPNSGAEESASPITVVLNWTAGLRK